MNKRQYNYKDIAGQIIGLAVISLGIFIFFSFWSWLGLAYCAGSGGENSFCDIFEGFFVGVLTLFK